MLALLKIYCNCYCCKWWRLGCRGGRVLAVVLVFGCSCFVSLWLQNDRLQNLLRFVLFFGVLAGCGRGVPHLKTGRGARVAVSPPISTKKININFG